MAATSTNDIDYRLALKLLEIKMDREEELRRPRSRIAWLRHLAAAHRDNALAIPFEKQLRLVLSAVEKGDLPNSSPPTGRAINYTSVEDVLQEFYCANENSGRGKTLPITLSADDSRQAEMETV